MAKGLPYFQFEPSEWENGNIQMCTLEEKGLFIDLCSIYWQRLGDLPYKLAVQKLCAGNATALRALCDAGIFEEFEGNICINFLNEQLEDRGATSKINSESAKKRWLKHRADKESDANAMRTQYESDANAMPIEENRREEKREREKNLSIKNSMLAAQTNLEAAAMQHSTSTENIVKFFNDFWHTNDYDTNATNQTESEIRIHFNRWLKKNKPPQIKFVDEWGVEGVDYLELNVIESQEETKFNDKIEQGWVKYTDYLMRYKIKK